MENCVGEANVSSSAHLRSVVADRLYAVVPCQVPTTIIKKAPTIDGQRCGLVRYATGLISRPTRPGS
jgi:hypothetical protein